MDIEEIKADEILRTERGKFYKIVSETEDDYLCIELNNKTNHITLLSDLPTIVNHSKNKKELVQEGDFVNGYICKYITDIDTGEEHLCNFDLNEMRWIPLEEIDVWESIVTSEQFSSVEYVF